jgi:hypothetical protein
MERLDPFQFFAMLLLCIPEIDGTLGVEPEIRRIPE